MAAAEPDALVAAILHYQTSTLLKLLRYADPTVRDQAGLTPLHHAVLAGNADAVHALLDHACKRTRPLRLPGGAPSQAAGSPWDLVAAPGPPPSRPSPLHLAAERSDQLLRILLGHSSLTTAGTSFLGITFSSRPQPELLKLRDARGWSLLHYAVSRSNLGTLRLLVQHFSESSGSGGCSSGGGTVGAATPYDVGVDIVDAIGHTALHQAALLGHAECCRLLLKAGADQAAVSNPPEAVLPIHLAACGNHTGVVDVLFRHAVAQQGFRAAQAVLLRPNTAGLTALHLATLHAAVDAARRLLHLVFPFDTRGPVDRTAFHLAALKGCTPMLNTLIRHSTPLQRELHDAEGFMAAHLAAAAGRLDALRVLAAGGCNMNSRAVAAPAAPPDCEGWTPLHCAVRRGEVAAIELLLGELGADPHAKDDCGRTPCDLAVAIAACGSRHGSAAGAGGSGVHNVDDSTWSPLDGMAMEPERESEGSSADRIGGLAASTAALGLGPTTGIAAGNLQGPSVGLGSDVNGVGRLEEARALVVLQTFLRLLHEPLVRRSMRLTVAPINAASSGEASPLHLSGTLPSGESAPQLPPASRSPRNGSSGGGGTTGSGVSGTASPALSSRLGSSLASGAEAAADLAAKSPRRRKGPGSSTQGRPIRSWSSTAANAASAAAPATLPPARAPTPPAGAPTPEAATAAGACLCHLAAAAPQAPPQAAPPQQPLPQPGGVAPSIPPPGSHAPSMALAYAAQMLAGPAATPTRASPFSRPAVTRPSPFQPQARPPTVNEGAPAAAAAAEGSGGTAAAAAAEAPTAAVASPVAHATKPSPFVAATRPSPFAAAATRPSPFQRQPNPQPAPPTAQKPPPPTSPRDSAASSTEAPQAPEAVSFGAAAPATSLPPVAEQLSTPFTTAHAGGGAAAAGAGLAEARSSGGGARSSGGGGVIGPAGSSREAPSAATSDTPIAPLCVISPINSPCGYSALNRAILLQRHALADALLATVPSEGHAGGVLVVTGGPPPRDGRTLSTAVTAQQTTTSTGTAVSRNLSPVASHAQLLLLTGTSSAEAAEVAVRPGTGAAAARPGARAGSFGPQLPPPGPSARSKRHHLHPQQQPAAQPLLQQLLQQQQQHGDNQAKGSSKRTTEAGIVRTCPLVPLGGPGGSLPAFPSGPQPGRDLMPSLIVWDEASEVFRTQASNHTNREWLHWPGEPDPATGWLLVELVVMEAGAAGGHVWLGLGPTPELFLPPANESTASSASLTAAMPASAATGSGAAASAAGPGTASSLLAPTIAPGAATGGPGAGPAATIIQVAMCSVMNHPSTHVVCVRDGQSFRGGVLSPDLGAAERLEARSGDTVALFWNRRERTAAFTLNGRYCGRIAGLPKEDQLTPVVGLQSAAFVFKWRCVSMVHGSSNTMDSACSGGAAAAPQGGDAGGAGAAGARPGPALGFSANIDGLMVREQMLHEDPETPWMCKEPSMTSLHFAAWAGNSRVLAQLVRNKGFDPDEPDADGWVPLHFAALAGHPETVRLLLSFGCQPGVRSRCGSTPALLTAKYGRSPEHVTIVRLLADAGAALDVRDARGRTLLMLAARAGNLAMVELLLECGLDASATDCQDREAQQYAGQHAAIFRLLRNAQAAQRAGARKSRRHARTPAATGALEEATPAALHALGSTKLLAGAATAAAAAAIGPAAAAGAEVVVNGGGGMTDARQGDEDEDEESSAEDSGSEAGGNAGYGRVVDQKQLPLLAERWRVGAGQLVRGRLIEQGAFGAVFEGMWCGARVAIKQVVRRPASGGGGGAAGGGGGGALAERELVSLQREVAILTALPPHERIARMLGSVELPGEGMCLVMAYYPHTLQSVMQSERLRRSWLTPARRAAIVRQLAEGLAFLHGLPGPRVIHRDLKPNNVLLEAAPSLGVKICDFGLSRILAGTDVQSSSGAGHAFWMAPELLRAQSYDEKVDVYSYGVILYQVAYWVDDQLYGGLNKAQVDFQVVHGILRLQDRLPGGVDPAVQALVRDCVDEDSRARPSMAQVLERLAGMRELPQPGQQQQQQQQLLAGQLQGEKPQPGAALVAGGEVLERAEQAAAGVAVAVGGVGGGGAGAALGVEMGAGGLLLPGQQVQQQQARLSLDMRAPPPAAM